MGQKLSLKCHSEFLIDVIRMMCCLLQNIFFGNLPELLQCFSFGRLSRTIFGRLKSVILGKLQYFSFREIEICRSQKIEMYHFREIEMCHFREIEMYHFREIEMCHFREIEMYHF